MNKKSFLAIVLVTCFVFGIMAVSAYGLKLAPGKLGLLGKGKAKAAQLAGKYKVPVWGGTYEAKASLKGSPNPDSKRVIVNSDRSFIKVYPFAKPNIDYGVGKDGRNLQWALDNVASNGTVQIMMTDAPGSSHYAVLDLVNDNVEIRNNLTLTGERIGNTAGRDWTETDSNNRTFVVNYPNTSETIKSDRAVIYGGLKEIIPGDTGVVLLNGPYNVKIEGLRFERQRWDVINVIACGTGGVSVKDNVMRNLSAGDFLAGRVDGSNKRVSGIRVMGFYAIPAYTNPAGKVRIGFPLFGLLPSAGINGPITIEKNQVDIHTSAPPDPDINNSIGIAVFGPIGSFDPNTGSWIPQNLAIKNNVIRNNAESGIWLAVDPPPFAGKIEIIGNEIYAKKFYDYLLNEGITVIRMLWVDIGNFEGNFFIEGNTVKDVKSGIVLCDTSYVQIKNNHIKTYWSGITLLNLAFFNYIDWNTVPNTNPGLTMPNSSFNSIEANTITGKGAWAIHIGESDELRYFLDLFFPNMPNMEGDKNYNYVHINSGDLASFTLEADTVNNPSLPAAHVLLGETKYKVMHNKVEYPLADSLTIIDKYPTIEAQPRNNLISY